MRTIEELEHKAHRVLRREGARKAALVYEQMCRDLPDSARHWALLGSVLLAAHRTDEAVLALRTAVWLRMREGDLRRAAALARVLLRHADGDRTAERALERFAQAA